MIGAMWYSHKKSCTVVTSTRYHRENYIVKEPSTGITLTGRKIKYNISVGFPFIPFWDIWLFRDCKLIGFEKELK